MINKILINTLVLLSTFCWNFPVLAQKKPLDHSVYDKWQDIGEKYISNNGQYVVYAIQSQDGRGKLVVKAVDHAYRQEFPGGSNASIAENNDFVIFKIRAKIQGNFASDTLVVVEPGKNKITKIPGIKSYKIPEHGSGAWLAYRIKKDQPTPEDELVLLNLYNGQERRYPSIADYYFDRSGKILLIKTAPHKEEVKSKASLLWISLQDGKIDTVVQGFEDARNFAFDETGKQLAFLARHTNPNESAPSFYALWHYKAGLKRAVMRVNNETEGVEKGFTLSSSGMPVFSKDGRKLFFGLARIPNQQAAKPAPETAGLDIWHYKDEYLQSEQLNYEMQFEKSFKAVLNGSDPKVVSLTRDKEKMTLADNGNANYVLVTRAITTTPTEKQRQATTTETAYLVSTQDGSRIKIKDKSGAPFSLSPGGKFMVWFDEIAKHFFIYDIARGDIRNVTQKISLPLYYEDDRPDEVGSFGIGGWIENDAALLVYDRYDIWQIDPRNIKQPVNITQGYGRRNNIVLRFKAAGRELTAIPAKADILLTAFNCVNKYNGFFSKQLGNKAEPVQLSMGPYSYAMMSSKIVNRYFEYADIRKANNAATYLVTRMSTSESPDLFTTKDFRQFNRISAINPQQKEYNWMKSELVKWKMFDGKEAEGILYKPEDFDPAKKYPVIFHFYEQDADALYQYRVPAASAAEINIPYFVSNGYLVFDPNIYYKIGDPGESIYNSVVSAAKHLSRMPWVDSTKIGIQGHSYGGYEVSFLVTRTNLFAAAVTCSGPTDLISSYGGMRSGTGRSNQYLGESGQFRLGVTPWQDLNKYIKNSPLFGADKVTTPLLIMHNQDDGTVPFAQAVEYFTALRRLDKKVWMLQYDGEDHFIMQDKNQKDFSIRLAQFFDHYLKGAPMPKWLKEGLPASLKGIDLGLEISQ